jgi:hypothetical protein
MRWAKAVSLLFSILISVSTVAAVNAQTETLRPGESIERTIVRGKPHGFTISLEREQFLQLVVEQHGVDVVVNVVSPDGKSLGAFDSPNGTEGPENVSLVTDAAGVYRIVVLPLEHEENTTSGRYVIRIKELRAATGVELETIKSREKVKAKGVALLAETAEGLALIRLTETRVRLQVQAAHLLWDADEKLARKLIDEAVAGVKQYIENVDTDDTNYYQSYQTAMQLRSETVTTLTPRNPELALSFLRSTRVLTDPNAEGSGQLNQELQLEISIASQIAAKDSKRALHVAQESLKKGYSYNLIDTLSRLQTTDPEAAAKLAGELAAKLQTEDLLKNQEAASLLISLLQLTRSQTSGSRARGTAEASKPGLLSEHEHRALFSRALSAALAYNQPATGYYSVERNSAQNILNGLKNMSTELEQYAPGRAAAIEKKSKELDSPPDPQNQARQKYQEAISNGSLDAALEAVARAPLELRSQLYQEIAQKAVGAGDFARARQILTDNISNPLHRRQALRNLEQQVIYNALNSGKLDEALRSVANIPSPKERARMLTQIVNQSGARQKKEAMLRLLEQARELVAGNGRVEDQEQMTALFEIARAYQRYEPRRGFEIVESIVGQFNEMGEAAVSLNGFGQQYFRDGELMLQNGNALSNIVTQLATALGALSSADFDRARAAADRVQRPEARLVAYLAIARNAINQRPNEWSGINWGG